MTALVVEMWDINAAGYGSVHRAGCRHVRDGMPMGDAQTREQARNLFLDATGWELDDDEHPHYAPCTGLSR